MIYYDYIDYKLEFIIIVNLVAILSGFLLELLYRLLLKPLPAFQLKLFLDLYLDFCLNFQPNIYLNFYQNLYPNVYSDFCRNFLYSNFD